MEERELSARDGSGPDVAEITNNCCRRRKESGRGGWNKLIANF